MSLRLLCSVSSCVAGAPNQGRIGPVALRLTRPPPVAVVGPVGIEALYWFGMHRSLYERWVRPVRRYVVHVWMIYILTVVPKAVTFFPFFAGLVALGLVGFFARFLAEVLVLASWMDISAAAKVGAAETDEVVILLTFISGYGCCSQARFSFLDWGVLLLFRRFFTYSLWDSLLPFSW